MIIKKITTVLLTTSILSQSIFPSFAMDMDSSIIRQQRGDQSGRIECSEPGLFALNPCFQGCESLSPLYGLLVLKSGILSNIRFNGLYDAQNSAYLTHYTITNPHDHEATSHKDSPQDYTASLLQQFFPSPAGGTLMLPGSHDDFFKLIPVERIAELLIIYTQEKQKYQQNNEISPLQDFMGFFQDCFGMAQKGAKQTKGGLLEEKWSLNKGDRKRLNKLWQNQGSLLPKIYADLFANAIKETHKYPKNIIESALSALAWKKMNLPGANPAALTNFLKKLQPKQTSISQLDSSQFSKSYYEKWKKTGLDEAKKIKPEAFEELLKNPEDLVFMTLMYDVYDNPFPQILGTGSAVHTYIDHEGKIVKEIFPDCGESSLRNFFNMIFGDQKSRTFNLETFKIAFPHASKKLIAFYEIDPTNPGKFSQSAFENVNDGVEGRSAWADVLSSLNKLDDSKKIKYRQADGRCNIAGIGLDNMLLVLEKLLGEPLSQMALDTNDEDKRRAIRFTHILTKLSGGSGCEESTGSGSTESSGSYDDSNDESGLSWHVNGENESLPNFGTISIQLNGEDLFEWSFDDHHFQFDRSASNPCHDWRHLPLEQFRQLLTSPLPETLKSHLIPFYVGDGDNSENEGSDNEDSSIEDDDFNAERNQFKEIVSEISSKGFMNEFLFGYNLGGAEQKIDLMDQLIPLNTDLMKELFPLWLKKMPIDEAVNRMLVCFIFKHQNFFSEQVLGETGDRVVNLYNHTLANLENDMTCKLFKKYLNTDHSKELLIHFLNNFNVENFVHLKDSHERSPLHVACEALWYDFDIVKLLLEKGADINAKDENGESPLNCAFTGIRENKKNAEVLRFFIENGADINSQTNSGDTLLSSLLNSEANLGEIYSPGNYVDAIKLLLDSGVEINIENKNGSSPLWAFPLDWLLDYLPQDVLLNHISKFPEEKAALAIWKRYHSQFESNPELRKIFSSGFKGSFYFQLAKVHPELLPSSDVFQSMFEFTNEELICLASNAKCNYQFSLNEDGKDTIKSIMGSEVLSRLAKLHPSLARSLFIGGSVENNAVHCQSWNIEAMLSSRDCEKISDTIEGYDEKKRDCMLNLLEENPKLMEDLNAYMAANSEYFTNHWGNLWDRYLAFTPVDDILKYPIILQKYLFSGKRAATLIKNKLLSYSEGNKALTLLNELPALQENLKMNLTYEDRQDILRNLISRRLEKFSSSLVLKDILFLEKKALSFKITDPYDIDKFIEIQKKYPELRKQIEFEINQNQKDLNHCTHIMYYNTSIDDIVSFPMLQDILFRGDKIFKLLNRSINFPKAIELLNLFPECCIKFSSYLKRDGHSMDLDHLKSSAAINGGNNSLSQTWLGFIYQYGLGVNENYQEAIKWYTMAANQGNVIAQNQISKIPTNELIG